MSINEWLPQRSETVNKYDCGNVVIIAGSRSMLGAAVLTARAALRTGCGLAHLITVSDAVPQLAISNPEVIVHGLPTENGYLALSNLQTIESLINDLEPDSLVIGPGLGCCSAVELCQTLLTALCSEKALPTVIDADALNALDMMSLASLTEMNFILTPHGGEFARLFGQEPSDDPKHREQLIKSAQSYANQVIVLKGHQTLIKAQGKIHTNTTGNPGMATAGSGDVLAGMIGSLLAQGLSHEQAAVAGVSLHGLAGDMAYEEHHNGLIASDIIEHIPTALQEILYEDEDDL